MREPLPDWSPLEVTFKILDEHPHLFYIRVPPPPGKYCHCSREKILHFEESPNLGVCPLFLW